MTTSFTPSLVPALQNEDTSVVTRVGQEPFEKCFGPQVVAHSTEETVRTFKLWAPGATRVNWVLWPASSPQEPSHTGQEQPALEKHRIPMDPAESLDTPGWFVLRTHLAKPGSRYQYEVFTEALPEGLCVPDIGSAYQPEDIHGPSQVVDHTRYVWQAQEWQGRPWEETVLYELHVGTFTPEGTFQAIIPQLDRLKALGVTAIELMPVADFPGTRNWGYDGVLPFAPDSRYGTPDDLKALIDAAHQKGLMVFLDVVYNHFGPEGNYLHVYAKPFFTDRYHTPWGDAINYDGEGSTVVRQLMIENMIYWLETFRFDGLRLDAVHAIEDQSPRHILKEAVQRVRQYFASHDLSQHAHCAGRHIHLVLENDDNTSRYLPQTNEKQLASAVPAKYNAKYNAQWNDDIHHVFHVLLTGEHQGYYEDYATHPLEQLGRCLNEGFAYQGDPSPFRDGELRGEKSNHLPLTAFVNFIQNHDQVGNRAFGERLSQLTTEPALRAAATAYLLAPGIPMIFMGEETGTQQPFPFFCDFTPFGDLAQAVTEGRRKEFAKFPEFSNPETRNRIPDPNAEETYRSAVLSFPMLLEQQAAQDWQAFYQAVLALRHQYVVPLLKASCGYIPGRFTVYSNHLLGVTWEVEAEEAPNGVRKPLDVVKPGKHRMTLCLNFSDEAGALPMLESLSSKESLSTLPILLTTPEGWWSNTDPLQPHPDSLPASQEGMIRSGELSGHSALWFIEPVGQK